MDVNLCERQFKLLISMKNHGYSPVIVLLLQPLIILGRLRAPGITSKAKWTT